LGGIGAILLYGIAKQHIIRSDSLVLLAVLAPSIILHEVSHGLVALWFGDDTAKRAGRLTLNPLAHIDPFGTVVLPIMMALVGGAPFGYAKPVPVNPRQLRHPRNEGVLVSLAGPATNIILAVLAALVFRAVASTLELAFVAHAIRTGHLVSGLPGWHEFLLDFGIINVVLATFNLIPLPPLDGSSVIERFLPARWWTPYLRLRRYSMLIVIGVVFWLPGHGLQTLFSRAFAQWGRLL